MASHILYGKVKSFATSDDDYYEVAAQVGAYVNTAARRTDITAVISSEAGMGAPACFIPSLAEVHLNHSIVPLGRPDKVNVPDHLWRLEHAAAMGAMRHEAAHARHTTWDPRDLMETYGATRKVLDVITTLEEPRIEAQAVREDKADKVFLRGCAMEIVGRDFTIPDSRYGAAAAAGLLLARVDAGVLSRTEVRNFRREIEGVLGATLDVLEPLWQRFLLLWDRDYAGMVAVAQEWLEALGEDPEDASGMVGESMMGEPLPGDPESGEGEGQGSAGEGEGNESESKSGFGDRIKAGARKAEVEMDGEVVEARADERSERRAKERKADSERKAEGKKEYEKARKRPGGGHGFSPDGFAHLIGSRPANAFERRAARTLARELEKIDYRDRAVTKVASAVPPGRLRGRVAVQESAARAQGRDFTGEPWIGKRRKRVESTPLTVGIAVDISGSMMEAMEPLASTQYVLSTAGAHIDASVATVHFGQRVHSTAPKGYREKEVRIFQPADGYEAFKDAALTLDYELNLLNGTGARLLIVASDGVFVDADHRAYATTFVPLAQRKGVGVIFLDFTGYMGYGNYGASVVDCAGMAPHEVAAVVGKACIAELRKMDSRG